MREGVAVFWQDGPGLTGNQSFQSTGNGFSYVIASNVFVNLAKFHRFTSFINVKNRKFC